MICVLFVNIIVRGKEYLSTIFVPQNLGPDQSYFHRNSLLALVLAEKITGKKIVREEALMYSRTMGNQGTLYFCGGTQH